MNDPVLQELVANQYGILVPENELKPVGLRPSPTTYDFSVSDQIFDFAEKHHLQMRGHTLVWHGSVPAWVRNNAGQLNLRDVMVDHIRTVVGRYKGRVHSWDVVNEAILPSDKEPGGLRKTVWYNAIGPEYIDLAYRTAREADPHVKLCYNDYGVEYNNEQQAEKRRDILALVRHMKDNKVPIDAVGIQSHIRAVSTSTIGKGLTDYMDAIRGMGLEIYLTELDVNDDDVESDDIAERDKAVEDTYRHFLGLALASPALKLILTWGVSDRMTWLNGGQRHKHPTRGERPLPFDPQYRPTPAFFAIRDSIDARSRT
jgi:endo-1,4-beta-xylanase